MELDQFTGRQPAASTTASTGACTTSPKCPTSCTSCRTCGPRFPFDLINTASGRRDQAMREHKEIPEAFAARDTSAAMLAMRKHIKSGWDVLKSERAATG